MNINIIAWVASASGMVFLATCAAIMFESHRLYYLLKKAGVPLDFFYMNNPLYPVAKYKYYKNCSEYDLSSISKSHISGFKRKIGIAFFSLFVGIVLFWVFLMFKTFAL